MIILGIDHGMKNIGIAICDEMNIAARSLKTIPHVSKLVDARNVLTTAGDLGAVRIIVGVSYDEEGFPNEAGQRALNFLETLRAEGNIDAQAWDESLTTSDAKALRLETGRSRKARVGHHDALAAAILLQSYIDQLERTS